MTQQLAHSNLQDATFRLIDLLDRHSDQIPLLDEELERHREIAYTMADQTRQAELALSAWRVALARRWDCEVVAQRVYSLVLRQLSLCYGDNQAPILLIAPPHPDAALTPAELLRHVRQLDAVLDLLTPRPPCADALGQQLRVSAVALAAAIDQTEHCETERRSLLAEQRLTTQLLQQAYERTHSLLMRHLNAEDLARLSLPAAADLAAASNFAEPFLRL